MADFDRYLAACEDRDADRRLSDEDQDRLSRREDAYVKMLNSPEYQRWRAGLCPVEGYEYDDEGRMVEIDADDPEMAEDDDDRESRLDRLATDAEYRSDCDRDREMEDRA